jgi:hypothetical protein
MANDYFDEGDFQIIEEHKLARASAITSIARAVVSGFDKLPAPDALREDRVTYIEIEGGPTEYTGTLTGLEAYAAGMTIKVKPAMSNTGAATLNLNGLGAVAVKTIEGSDLSANDLPADAVIPITYTGSEFRLAGSSISGVATAVSAASAASNSANQAASSALAAANSAIAAANSANQASNSAANAAAALSVVALKETTVTGDKSLTGGGDLSANRKLELVNDEETPGAAKVYGTDGGGDKGWVDLLAAHLPDGVVVQSAFAEIATNTDLSTALPQDDTPPQSNEGTEVLQVTITPKFSTSKVLVIADLWGATNSATSPPAIALFVDSETDARAAKLCSENRTGAGGGWVGTLVKWLDAGSNSAHTYKIRVGALSGVTVRLNGNMGSRFYGGVGICSMTVMEIKA